jgi:hypothetical protein
MILDLCEVEEEVLMKNENVPIMIQIAYLYMTYCIGYKENDRGGL